MTIWLLRLFSAYVALERRVLDLQHQNALLEHSVDAARQDAAAQSAVAVAKDAAGDDLKRMVDALSYRCDRRYVFGRNEEIEPMPTPAPVPARRQFARDLVNEQTRKAMQAYHALKDAPAMDEIAQLKADAAELMEANTGA